MNCNQKTNVMKVYQVFKVTNGGAYLIGVRSTLKNAIRCAKIAVAMADIASAARQCMPKGEIENGLFYASVRLLHDQYGIDAEIWKTDIYHEQTGSW